METEKVRELVGEIRRMLAELEEELAQPGREGEVDASWLRSVLRARRARARYFSSDLFADPARDMMLDLMAARLEGRAVSVSSLCLAAGVPHTTALRWVGILVERGIVVRNPDVRDRRRVFVALTDFALLQFEAWLAGLQKPLAVAI
jgi:DNA-binding transcriptional ArsR family regulator